MVPFSEVSTGMVALGTRFSQWISPIVSLTFYLQLPLPLCFPLSLQICFPLFIQLIPNFLSCCVSHFLSCFFSEHLGSFRNGENYNHSYINLYKYIYIYSKYLWETKKKISLVIKCFLMSHLFLKYFHTLPKSPFHMAI